MSAERKYAVAERYGAQLCEHEGCVAAAEYVVEYTEDCSYRYMDRWVKDEFNSHAYFCDAHLPIEARPL